MNMIGLQPAHPRGVPAGVAGLQGLSGAARGPRGPHEAREVLPALYREGLYHGAHGADLPRDPKAPLVYCTYMYIFIVYIM